MEPNFNTNWCEPYGYKYSETHNEVDKQQNSGLDRNLDQKITLYQKTKCIGKEFGPVVYNETRTRSMWRCHKISYTLISQLLIFVLAKNMICTYQKSELFNNKRLPVKNPCRKKLSKIRCWISLDYEEKILSK